MAYPQYLRLKARELRIEKQLTLDELVERLALPKSTVYYWIKDLPLGRPRRWSAGQRKGTRAMQAKYRRLREEAYTRGWAEYDELVRLPTFRDFVALHRRGVQAKSKPRVDRQLRCSRGDHVSGLDGFAFEQTADLLPSVPRRPRSGEAQSALGAGAGNRRLGHQNAEEVKQR